MTEDANEKTVWILRIHNHTGDRLAVAKAQMRPGLPGVRGLLDAVACRPLRPVHPPTGPTVGAAGGGGTDGGVATLTLAERSRHGPKLPDPTRDNVSVELRKGLRWLDENFDPTRSPGADWFYTMWTIQRVGQATGRRTFNGIDWFRHVTAEILQKQALAQNERVSLATVYNTLHQFTRAGMLCEVVVESARSYFDTNTTHHHHFFCEESQVLKDIPCADLRLINLPTPPKGAEINQIDVVIRTRPTAS